MSSEAPKTTSSDGAFTEIEGEDADTRIEGTTGAPLSSADAPDTHSVFESAPDARRYEVRRLLGQGGYGRVYAAYDRDLRRAVALKAVTPPPGVARELFIREARVTAGLVHPNIPALYDVSEKDGTFFLSMEEVSGQSLGSMIRAAAKAGRTEVMPPITLMEVMLKVADALAYAHSEGVVHRDVKPDNIVIGSYGEVMLVDWGAAHLASEELGGRNLVIGTPAYMAPEQLTSGVPTPSSDIYGLGATLFHSVLLRAPLGRSETERFWERKARGSIDPPTKAEMARAPRALLGVAMKAMSAHPRDRYASMNALGEALRDLLAGRKAWLAPVTETLDDQTYLERWVTFPEGAFERRGDRLVSSGAAGCLLLYKQRLAAGVALEFDGEILAGERPGDLSVFWTEDDVLEPEPHWPLRGTISLQVGAYDNLAAGIYRDFAYCLQGRSLSIEVGRTYLIRAEVDEQAFRLYLDGKLLAEYDQLFSTPSGYVGIYSYAPGKAISNIRVYERAVPERISPNAVGDAFYTRGEYAAAAAQYARVEQRLPETELAEEARFKRGLCCLRDGHQSLAENLWGELRAASWRARAALHLVDLEFQAGRHPHVVAELDRLIRLVPGERALVVDRWVQYVHSLCTRDIVALDGYRELRERHFPDDPGSAAAAADLELARGSFGIVVARYPEQHRQYFEALCALGEFARAAESYRGVPWMSEMAHIYLNEFELVQHRATRALAHALRGELETALAIGDCVEALLPMGRYDEVLQHRYTRSCDYAAALRGRGRIEEAAQRGDGPALCLLDAGPEALTLPLVLDERLYVLHHLALQSAIRGDFGEYRRYATAASEMPLAANTEDLWLARHFLLPILDRELGDEGAVERSARRVVADFPLHWRAKGLHLARFVLGETSLADFEAQPVRLFMRARSLLARALRAEYSGDRAAAAACYREYLNLPERERFSDSSRRDPLVDRWAAFRAGGK
jgi:hypothetical protein